MAVKKTIKNPVGRPKTEKGLPARPPSKAILVHVPWAYHKKLVKIARQRSCYINECIRIAIYDYLHRCQ